MRTAMVEAPGPNQLVGVVLKMPGPAMVELAGFGGADLVVLDTEHGIADGAQLEQHVRAGDAAGVPVLVRIPALDPAHVQTALDAGATGVVVPHVSSAADARRCVAAAHYPPAGTRGLALTTRAGRQGTADLEEHLHRAAERTVVIAQIEDPAAVAAIDEILAVPGITGVWIGLNDLAMSLREADGTVPDGAVDAAAETVCAAARGRRQHLAVVAGDPVAARTWHQRGATVALVTGHDLFGASLTAYLLGVRDDRAPAGPDQRERAAGPSESRRT